MTTQLKERRFPLIPVLIGIGAIALITTIVLTLSGGSEFGTPEVSGDALPTLPEQGSDPALGMTMPTVDGENFSGDRVQIADDGASYYYTFTRKYSDLYLVEGLR